MPAPSQSPPTLEDLYGAGPSPSQGPASRTDEENNELIRLLDGRVLGTLPFGSPITFKRWHTADGDPMGLEIRPFGMGDYGYLDDRVSFISTGIWALDTVASLKINKREALFVLAGAMLVNDLWLTTSLEKPVSGSSFVHNVQAGYILEKYMNQKKSRSTLSAGALAATLGADLYAIYDEHQKGYDFNSVYKHSWHGIGLAAGALASWCFRKI